MMPISSPIVMQFTFYRDTEHNNHNHLEVRTCDIVNGASRLRPKFITPLWELFYDKFKGG